jgi:hypothetical protein
MGCNLYVHVGPYLRLEEVPIKTIINRCQRQDCPLGDSKFCPDCGMKKEQSTETRESLPSDSFFHETHVDVLVRIYDLEMKVPEGVSYAVSNSTAGPGKEYSRFEPSVVREILPERIGRELKSFQESHLQHMQILQSLGVEVSLHWGVISHYS